MSVKKFTLMVFSDGFLCFLLELIMEFEGLYYVIHFISYDSMLLLVFFPFIQFSISLNYNGARSTTSGKAFLLSFFLMEGFYIPS